MHFAQLYFIYIDCIFFPLSFPFPLSISFFLSILYSLSLFADALRVVKDRKYGAKNADEVGGWDGMVGELVRRVCLYPFYGICINSIQKHKLEKPLLVIVIECDALNREQTTTTTKKTQQNRITKIASIFLHVVTTERAE